jgi:hypothetical protein
MVQVKVLEFHVTQPWIAMADKNQVLTIWDYSTDQVRQNACLQQKPNRNPKPLMVKPSGLGRGGGFPSDTSRVLLV